MHARTSEPARDGDLPCRALDATRPPAVLLRSISLDLGSELVGNLDSRYRAASHELCRPAREHEDVGDDGHVVMAVFQVEQELLQLAGIVAHLRDDKARAGDELLFELEVLRDELAFAVLERVHHAAAEKVRRLLHLRAAWRLDGKSLVHLVRELLDLGVEHNLFFERTPWLWGWRPGLPGAVCNNLYSSLRVLCGLRPGPDTLAAWDGMRARFAALTDIFLPGAEGYLLACRLRETLSPTMPDAVDRRGLTNQREALFGHPMTGGGIVGELLEMTDELLYRGQRRAGRLSRPGASLSAPSADVLSAVQTAISHLRFLIPFPTGSPPPAAER